MSDIPEFFKQIFDDAPCPLCSGSGFYKGEVCECVKRKVDSEKSGIKRKVSQ